MNSVISWCFVGCSVPCLMQFSCRFLLSLEQLLQQHPALQMKLPFGKTAMFSQCFFSAQFAPWILKHCLNVMFVHGIHQFFRSLGTSLEQFAHRFLVSIQQVLGHHFGLSAPFAPFTPRPPVSHEHCAQRTLLFGPYPLRTQLIRYSIRYGLQNRCARLKVWENEGKN